MASWKSKEVEICTFSFDFQTGFSPSRTYSDFLEKCHVTLDHFPSASIHSHCSGVAGPPNRCPSLQEQHKSELRPPTGEDEAGSEQSSTSVWLHHVEVLQVELLSHPGVISEIIHGKAHHLQAWTKDMTCWKKHMHLKTRHRLEVDSISCGLKSHWRSPFLTSAWLDVFANHN